VGGYRLAFVGADGNPERKGGLNRFNKNSNTFTRYLNNKNDPHSLIDNPVRAIYEDTYGNFWVGTSGDGLHTMTAQQDLLPAISMIRGILKS
jgi:ligand-binding sensor domain-containing protein